jgi:hypothetical protein
VIVPRRATQSATTVVEKVTSPANALLRLNQNPATDAVKKAMSHVNAQTKSLAKAAVAVDGAAALVAAATPAAVVTLAVVVVAAAVKNVTSAARSVTLPVIALRAEELVTAVEVGMVADTAAEAVVVVVAAVAARPATPAAASVTCLATAPRARNVTTVSPTWSSSS